jgi:replicative DNA helicase
LTEALRELDERGALSAIGIAAFLEPAIADCVAHGLAAYRRSSRACRSGRLAFLCGRDSAVNSLLSEAIAFHAAEAADVRRRKAADGEGAVLLVSFRQSARDIAIRALAARSRQRRKPSEEETERVRLHHIMEAASDLESLPLAICDERIAGSTAVIEAALRYRRIWGLSLMVVDDLQGFDAGWKPDENSVTCNSRKIDTLRAMAATLGVPIVVMATLASAAGAPPPRLADFAAAGYVERDGDLVLFVNTLQGSE